MTQKRTFASNINRFADQKNAVAVEQLPMSLPCTVKSIAGALVTVSIDVDSGFDLPDITIGICGFTQILQIPISVGDTGLAVASGVNLVDSSPTLQQEGNLCGRVFVPVSNAKTVAKNINNLVVTTNYSDGSYYTNPTLMFTQFAAFVAWANTHKHSSTGTPPFTLFTGNICTAGA